MKTIMYVPLDERPCNYDFPIKLAQTTEYDIIEPPIEILGDKKKPGDIEKLWDWVFENINKVQGAILSIDMLMYGGIVPSRLHGYFQEECIERLDKIRKLKEINSDVKIYAFNLIMRCPRYSSSDEEPDYYENYGEEIFKSGYIKHRVDLGLAEKSEILTLQEIEKILPEDILKDYTDRRKINREVNRKVIEYIKLGIIDFMVIPQDDSSPYGYTAIDQQYVRDYVSSNNLGLKVYMYPGADEVGCTLLARIINEDKGLKPLVYTRFSSVQGPYIIPLYEDRIVYESIKYQILCAGGLMCSNISEADIVLMVNSPGNTMMEAVSQNIRNSGYTVERNLTEYVEYIDYVVNKAKKPCVVADIAFANGGDLELIALLKEKKLLFELAGYAGWNTSSNSLGTCITQGMLFDIYGKNKSHVDFLGLRYVEDCGYCAVVRKRVVDERLPELGLNYFRVDGKRGKVCNIVKEGLQNFIDNNLLYDNIKIEVNECYMPWSRMFEVGLGVEVISN